MEIWISSYEDVRNDSCGVIGAFHRQEDAIASCEHHSGNYAGHPLGVWGGDPNYRWTVSHGLYHTVEKKEVQ